MGNFMGNRVPSVPKPTDIISHNAFLIENFQFSSQEFYVKLEQALRDRQMPDLKMERVDWPEGGIFSARREYLRVTRTDLVFDLCGAPFGTGFFVSLWFGVQPSGCLTSLPVIGWIYTTFFTRLTFYRVDQMVSYQQGVQNAVAQVVTEITTCKGIQPPSEAVLRPPIMKELYRRR
jgi:hypothetical protein